MYRFPYLSFILNIQQTLLFIINKFMHNFGNFFGGGFPHHQQQPQQQKEIDTTKLYQVLELTKQATIPEIKKSYRQKAMKEHPDKGGDPEKFRLLTQAYQILSNPQKRDLYDKYGLEGVKNGGPPSRGFFDFGKQDTGPKKCKPKLIIVPLSLKKVYEGGMHQVEVTRLRICVKCQGKGGKNAITCTTCKGNKYVQKLVMIGPGMYTQTAAPCDQCKGQGVIFQQNNKCQTCLGKRVVQQKKTIDLSIDPGVPHQQDYIHTGQADEYPGAMAGDIYFRINIEQNPQFRRKGADLYYKKHISLLQALTRVTFELTLLDGHKIIISTAPGEIIANGDRKIIKGKGMPFYKDPFSKGHLIIQFVVDFPKKGEIHIKDKIKLAQILGQKLNSHKGQNVIHLHDFTEQAVNDKQNGENQGQQWEDDGGDEQHQGQNVRCAQQ